MAKETYALSALRDDPADRATHADTPRVRGSAARGRRKEEGGQRGQICGAAGRGGSWAEWRKRHTLYCRHRQHGRSGRATHTHAYTADARPESYTQMSGGAMCCDRGGHVLTPSKSGPKPAAMPRASTRDWTAFMVIACSILLRVELLLEYWKPVVAECRGPAKANLNEHNGTQ